MLTLKQLQEEHKEWHIRNFDSQFPDPETYWKHVFGIMEELGELARALLKRSQGIRGSHSQHTEKAKDSIGDMLIFLAGTCSALDFDFQEILEHTWEEVRQRNYKKDKELVGNNE